jgi:hypothetical protein
MSAGATAPSAAAETVGIAIEMPAHAMIIGSTNRPYPPSAEASHATQPSPTACRASPAAISGRVPIRSATAPDSGATSIGVAVHGSSRSPVASGP